MAELPRTEGPSPIVGAELFRLVTVGMYDNPLAIYREYIQNSADAIASKGAYREGKVEISIDPSKRLIKILDNGPGLSNDDALHQLLPIGRSNKQMGTDRGFRGIGRLAGLAFAETVTFTTRARQDEPITRVTWNGSCLPDRTAPETEIEDVVRDCVDVQVFQQPGYPDHFFEVEVGAVARHAAGSLLNRDAVRRYVSEVCPVPMSTAFPYSQRIEGLFSPNDLPMSLDITLDGDPEPVKRPYEEIINLSASREDYFTECEEIHIPSVDRNLNAAVGWIAHPSYLGAIPKESRIRGIRARVGNIQIGDETIFDNLYAEERFNRWCVGEIHVLDSRIVPNARRDYFEPGPHLRNLENHLHAILRKVVQRCRTASIARNRRRRALTSLCHIEETCDLVMSGYLAADDAAALAHQALKRMPSVRQDVLTLQLGKNNVERLDRVETKLNDIENSATPCPFTDIPPAHVAAYQEVFGALATVSSSPGSAKELMMAILTRTSNPRATCPSGTGPGPMTVPNCQQEAGTAQKKV